MAKDSKIIRDWSGGINTLFAASDIEDVDSRVLKGLTNTSTGMLKQSGGLKKQFTLPTLPVASDKFCEGTGFISYNTDFGFCASLQLIPGVDFTSTSLSNQMFITFTSIDPEQHGFKERTQTTTFDEVRIFGSTIKPSSSFQIVQSTSTTILLRDNSNASNGLPYSSADTDFLDGSLEYSSTNPIWLVRQTSRSSGVSENVIAHYSKKAINFFIPASGEWVPYPYSALKSVADGSELVIADEVLNCTIITYEKFNFNSYASIRVVSNISQDITNFYNHINAYPYFAIASATDTNINTDYKVFYNNYLPEGPSESVNTILSSGDIDIGASGDNYIEWNSAVLSRPGTKLRVTTTSLSSGQGTRLTTSRFGALQAGLTYRIYLRLKRISGLDPIVVKVKLGGSTDNIVAREGYDPVSGAISDYEQEYYVDCTTVNTTGSLLITNSSATIAVFEIDNVSITYQTYSLLTAVKRLDDKQYDADNLFVDDTAVIKSLSGGSTGGEFSYNGGYCSNINLAGNGPTTLSIKTSPIRTFSKLMAKTTKAIDDANMNLISQTVDLAFTSVTVLNKGPQPEEALISGPAVAFDLRFKNNALAPTDEDDGFQFQNVHPTLTEQVDNELLFFSPDEFGGAGYTYEHLAGEEGGPAYFPEDNYLSYTHGPDRQVEFEPGAVYGNAQKITDRLKYAASYGVIHYATEIVNNSAKGVTGGTENIDSKAIFARARKINSMYSSNFLQIELYDGPIVANTLYSKAAFGQGLAIFPPIGGGANVHFYQNSTVNTQYVPLAMGNYLFYICYEYYEGGLSKLKSMKSTFSPEFNPKSRAHVASFAPSDEFPDTHTKVTTRQTKFHLTENTPIRLQYTGESEASTIADGILEITSVSHRFDNKTIIESGVVTNEATEIREDGIDSFTQFDIPIEYTSDELGVELWDSDSATGTVSDDWSVHSNNTVAVEASTIKITCGASGSPRGAFHYFRAAKDLSEDLIIGQVYFLSVDLAVSEGTSCGWRNPGGLISTDDGYPGPDQLTGLISHTDFRNYTCYFTATSETSQYIEPYSMSTGEIAYIDNMSIKKVTATSLSFASPSEYRVSSVSQDTICGPDQYLEANLLMTGPYDPRIKSMHIWVQKDNEKDMHRVAEVYTSGGYRVGAEVADRELFYPDIRTQETSINQSTEYKVNNVFLTTANYEGQNHLDYNGTSGLDISLIYTAFYSKLNQVNGTPYEVDVNNRHIPIKDIVNDPKSQKHSIAVDSAMLIESFYDDYGYYPFEGIAVSSFKCAAVIGDRSYIGSPVFSGALNNPGLMAQGGNLISQKDVVLQSVGGKPTLFNKWGILVGEHNDGDSIVALRSHEKRLFEFRLNSLYITNLEEPAFPVLESKIKGQGVNHQNHTCETTFGVCWINRKGLWLHDGLELKNIGAKLGGDEVSVPVSRLNFSSMTNTNLNSFIEFDPMAQQILWYESLGDSSSTSIWVYSFGNQSWHQIERKSTSVADGTNATLNLTNPIRVQGDGIFQTAINPDNTSADLIRYSSTNLPSVIHYETKDFDFEEPAVRKSIKSIYITYRLNRASFSGTATKYTVDSADNKLVKFIDPGHGLSLGEKIIFTGFAVGAFNATLRVVNVIDTDTFECIYPSSPAAVDTTATDNGSWVLATEAIAGGTAYLTYLTVNALANDNNSLLTFADNDDMTFDNNALYYPGNLTGAWVTTRLKPTSVINNKYKFSLYFNSDGGAQHRAPAGFEINDITIVYRKKKIK